MANEREILSQRVQQRIEELRTNARAVSMDATGKPDTIRDMLRRKSIPNTAILTKVAERLDTTTDWLLGRTDTVTQVTSEVHFRDVPQRWDGPPSERIPVLGTGYCDDLVVSDGTAESFEIERINLETDHTVRMIERPPALWNVRDPYAIEFIGSSMEPRYFQGELGIVNPSRVPSPGDFVVVQLNDGESDSVVTALVKQLVRVVGAEYELRQFNPDRTFRIDRRRVARMHKIMKSDELWR